MDLERILSSVALAIFWIAVRVFTLQESAPYKSFSASKKIWWWITTLSVLGVAIVIFFDFNALWSALFIFAGILGVLCSYVKKEKLR